MTVDKNKYSTGYLHGIKNAKNDKAIRALIDKIYEDGFTDGTNEGQEPIKKCLYDNADGRCPYRKTVNIIK